MPVVRDSGLGFVGMNQLLKEGTKANEKMCWGKNRKFLRYR